VILHRILPKNMFMNPDQFLLYLYHLSLNGPKCFESKSGDPNLNVIA
jgi:hypothetical protein